MNYSKGICAFYDSDVLESLSASAVNLWHLLLHINNRERWTLEFVVASNELKIKGSLSESAFQRAREELVANGLMTYRSRGSNLAPDY
jgi:hypothetical protein